MNVQILTEINILYKRKQYINTLLNILTDNIAGNYKLAPGIEWHNNICYFSSIIQLIYRIEELIPFIIHNNVKKQYKSDNYISYFIKFMEIMYNKADSEKNNIFTINEQQKITKLCIVGTGATFGFVEDPSQIGTPILNILSDICNIDYNSMNYAINAEYNDICIENHKKLPLNDPRTFFAWEETIYRCYLDIILNKNDFIDIKDGKISHSEIKMNNYLNEEKQNINNEIEKCKKFQEISRTYYPILSLNESNTIINIEELIKNNTKIEVKHTELENNKYQLFVEKTIYIPNKYFICDIANKTSTGHKVNIMGKNNDGIIELEYNNINQYYELIGATKYSHGHWTAYIKHANGWYLYDGSKRENYKSIPNDDLKMLFTLLYRQVDNNLFETIDPNSISENLKTYLDQYGV